MINLFLYFPFINLYIYYIMYDIMYDIIIFGGGLSGLTLAHELIKKKFKILIIEKDNDLGGMVRSDTNKNLFPSEHSWRGYAPVL